MKKITWTPKMQKLSILKEWDKNPRTITGEALERLKQRIADRGFHDVVKVDTNNIILSGTQRRKALEEMGADEVWTMVPDRKLTEGERKLIVLESNRNEGEDDWRKLKEYFSNEELMAGGFGKDEIAKFFDNLVEVAEDDFDADAEAAKITVPVSKLGDIWQMGQHRLICGDSSDPGAFLALTDGVKADMCWTDPPYNVKYDYQTKYGDRPGKRKKQHKGGSEVFSDNKSAEEYLEFLKQVFTNVFNHTQGSMGFYISYPTRWQREYLEAFEQAGFHFSQIIIWLKERLILSRGQDFHRIYEPIIYGWKEGIKHWVSKANSSETEVWDIDRVSFEERLDVWYLHRDKSKDYVHPTQKPVRLPERAIKKSCPLGGVVLEPFCGSGSALIACEQLRRKCYAIELDPRYVDVIVKRWQKLTGGQATCTTRPEAIIEV